VSSLAFNTDATIFLEFGALARQSHVRYMLSKLLPFIVQEIPVNTKLLKKYISIS